MTTTTQIEFPQDTEPNEYRYTSPTWLDAIAEGLTKGGGEASGRDLAADTC